MNKMIESLCRYWHGIGLALLLSALLNGFLRFDGIWKRFFTMVLVQLWFGQAVYNYARGHRVAIAPGGLSRDVNPEWRAALAGFALFLYVVVFFFGVLLPNRK
ncbi:hypothetical protein [Pseudomonas sp. S3_A03]